MSTSSNSSDKELLEWTADWQYESALAPTVRDAIRRRVKRQTVLMMLGTVGEMSFAVTVLVALIRLATIRRTAIDIAAMTGLSLLTLWAVGCSLWYRRGIWWPEDVSTRAFLAISILRCRRRLRALRTGWWLLAAEVALFIPWIGLQHAMNAPTLGYYGFSYGFLFVVAGGAALVLVMLTRRTRRQLRELERLDRSPSADLGA